MENNSIFTFESNDEKKVRNEMLELLKKCPIPNDQLLSNLGLFLNSKNLSRLLFMNDIYKKILEVPGVVFEFGSRWGQNVALFSALRGIYEPFNRHRKIVAFDTFEGFPSIHDKDGSSTLMQVGMLKLSDNYENFLDEVLKNHEDDNPLSHIKKYEIVKGDTTFEIDNYLERNPETIISLAYFDFDLYEPTKKCLEAIKHRLVKGSVLAFDELNDPVSPGETLALMEVVGLKNIKLKKPKHASRVTYFVVE